jgi:KaiC/GvpD/RAD55 family RecA-like ATPase
MPKTTGKKPTKPAPRTIPRRIEIKLDDKTHAALEEHCGLTPVAAHVRNLIEEDLRAAATKTERPRPRVVTMNGVPERPYTWAPTRIAPLDKVLGGGLIPGEVVLLTGPEGVGKTTLLLQISRAFSYQSLRVKSAGPHTMVEDHCYVDSKVLFASSEQPVEYMVRCARDLGIESDRIGFLSDTDGLNVTDVIESAVEFSADLIVLDSVDLTFAPGVSAEIGSPRMERAVVETLVKWAKHSTFPRHVIVVYHEHKVMSQATLDAASTVLCMKSIGFALNEQNKTSSAVEVVALRNRYVPRGTRCSMVLGPKGFTEAPPEPVQT